MALSELNNKNYFKYKSIRDPLYGFINLSKKEIEIINTSYFQRLRNIKQLAHEYVVYPSAVHTRFEHSLGTVHVANRMCDQLDIGGERKETIRQAILLHDIGHGPYSHLFEKVLDHINNSSFDHEDITRWIINEDPYIKSIVGNNRKDIIKILDKTSKILKSDDLLLDSSIVSSELDADKIDYLRRDSYHIGVMYGQFDLERIMYTLKRTPKNNGICIDQKGKTAIENYRLARYLMYAQVYEHHKRVTVDQMFLKAILLAIEDKILDIKALKTSKNSSHKNFLNYYLGLNDVEIYRIILENKKSKAAEILNQINYRKLLKRVCEYELLLNDDYEIISKISNLDTEKFTNELASTTNIDPAYIITNVSEINVKLQFSQMSIFSSTSSNYFE